MATLDEVYRKFGEVSEAVQLLEIQLGNMLIEFECVNSGLLEHPDSETATEVFAQVNEQTLGKLIRSLESVWNSTEGLEQLLRDALDSRNRLTHSFYLEHNFRRNSADGCDVMLGDLETIHECVLEAYKAIMRLYDIDLEEHIDIPLPTKHLRLR